MTFDTANALLVLAGANADLKDTADEIPPEEDGFNSALPEEADAPAPAPDDDPAVFDVALEEELPAREDWM